jgi:hypothetical protein
MYVTGQQKSVKSVVIMTNHSRRSTSVGWLHQSKIIFPRHFCAYWCHRTCMCFRSSPYVLMLGHEYHFTKGCHTYSFTSVKKWKQIIQALPIPSPQGYISPDLQILFQKLFLCKLISTNQWTMVHTYRACIKNSKTLTCVLTSYCHHQGVLNKSAQGLRNHPHVTVSHAKKSNIQVHSHNS